MPSTYSNLKIELMATGENNTTWGDITNLNLGTALEEAIVGSADVTFASANVTLTLTNTNASQAARNIRLRCTGTTGGARNLIVPAIEKVYIVQNDCGDTITVKNATGTGIAIPAGKSVWVYNDGINIIDAISALSSLVVSGDITASNINVDGGSVGSGMTVLGTGAITVSSPGYRGLPQNAQTSSYTLMLVDAGKHISITTGGISIPANSSVAFPVGTAISIYNKSGATQNISITSDTMYLGGTTSTGTRTIGARGICTVLKTDVTEWVITGAGVA